MSLFNLLSVSASGMSAQRTRAELLVENLANSETTRTREGGPYRRKDAVFEATPQDSPFADVFAEHVGEPSVGVEVSEVRLDEREAQMRYIPGHPDANAEGYVAFPNMSPAEDMADLIGATRGYQANIAAMSAVKDMIQRSVDLLR